MEPAFGWTLLSPKAIGRAEVQWREDVAGVRDEIGFLLLHQAYADRFFARTSVQQTRFRYALFVPWIYQKVAALDHQSRRPQRTPPPVAGPEPRTRQGRKINGEAGQAQTGQTVIAAERHTHRDVREGVEDAQ